MFVWFDVFSIEKMGGLNLNAFHLNPYLRTVAIKSKIHYSVYKGDMYSYLSLLDKIKTFYSKKDVWDIEFSDKIDSKLKDDLISKFVLEDKGENHFQLRAENSDKIKVAIDFIKSLTI